MISSRVVHVWWGWEEEVYLIILLCMENRDKRREGGELVERKIVERKVGNTNEGSKEEMYTEILKK